MFVFIFISIAPAADCTNNFKFHRTKYRNSERDSRHLDGFVDCEDYNIEKERSKDLLVVSCFTSDGLCHDYAMTMAVGFMRV